MQSSAMMALRALVLVVCLVAVPLFAIFGKDAPQVVRSLVENIVGASAGSAERHTADHDPPIFRPAPLARSDSPTNIGGTTYSNTVSAGTLVPLADHNRTPANPASDPFQRTSAGPSAAGSASSAAEAPRLNTSQFDANQAGQTADSQHALAQQSPDAPKASFPPDYFRAAEERLRSLGATYYLLETLGPSGDYRFYCKVAASDRPDQVFAFFATDHDPLQAINSVVRQVEGWRSHWMQ
jgi:hypothetical protein